jgi:hypothetical protein
MFFPWGMGLNVTNYIIRCYLCNLCYRVWLKRFLNLPIRNDSGYGHTNKLPNIINRSNYGKCPLIIFAGYVPLQEIFELWISNNRFKKSVTNGIYLTNDIYFKG